MSALASAYVRRHVLSQVNRTKGLTMMQLADVANDQGRTVAYTQQHAAYDMRAALPTIKRAFQGLMHAAPGSPGPFLLKLGNGRYEVLGVAGHDQRYCDSDECRGELEARRDAGGKISEKRRQQAAARMRAMRQRRQQPAGG